MVFCTTRQGATPLVGETPLPTTSRWGRVETPMVDVSGSSTPLSSTTASSETPVLSKGLKTSRWDTGSVTPMAGIATPMMDAGVTGLVTPLMGTPMGGIAGATPLGMTGKSSTLLCVVERL